MLKGCFKPLKRGAPNIVYRLKARGSRAEAERRQHRPKYKLTLPDMRIPIAIGIFEKRGKNL